MYSKDSSYWAYEIRPIEKCHLGHICKECKKPFTSLSEQIVIRRGGRIELKYHLKCFSGDADPRTQKNSSYNVGKWSGSQQYTAPKDKFWKMRTGSHF